MEKTPFEQTQQAVAQGRLTVPVVSTPNGQIDYFWYQICCHVRDLSYLAIGIKIKHNSLKELKAYYGLESRTAKGALEELRAIQTLLKAQLIERSIMQQLQAEI